MKKIIFLIAISLTAIGNTNILNGQTKKGLWLIEGNIGNLSQSSARSEYYSISTRTSDQQDFNLGLNPVAGYFFTDNFVAGAMLDLGFSAQNYMSYGSDGLKSYNDRSNGSTFGLNPFVRGYFTKNSKNRFYGQLGTGMDIGLSTYRTTEFNDTGEVAGTRKRVTNNSIFFVRVLIGFNHFFTDNFAFNTSIGYNYSLSNGHGTGSGTGIYSDYATKSRTQDSSNSLAWNLGFSIFFSGSKAKQN